MTGYRARVDDALRAAVAAEDELDDRDGRPPDPGGRQAGAPALRGGSAAVAGHDAAAVEAAVTDDVVRGGVAVELVQVGSLYHDDVIDEADTRRGASRASTPAGATSRRSSPATSCSPRRPRSPPASAPRWPGSSPPRSAGSARARSASCSSAYDAGRTEDELPRRHRGQDGGPVRHRLPDRRHRRRPPPPRHRPPHRVRPPVRHGVPDRRRRARRGRHRRAAGQAGRPRPRRGHLHPARCSGPSPAATSDLRPLLGRPIAGGELDLARDLVRGSDGVAQSIAGGPGLRRPAPSPAWPPSASVPSALALAGAARHLLLDAEAYNEVVDPHARMPSVSVHRRCR